MKKMVVRLIPFRTPEIDASAMSTDSEGTTGKKPSIRLSRKTASGIHHASAASRMSSSIKSSKRVVPYYELANDVDNEFRRTKGLCGLDSIVQYLFCCCKSFWRFRCQTK